MAQTNIVNYQRLDNPDVEQTEFGSDMKRWLANIVDTLNQNMGNLSQMIAMLQLNVGGSGAGPINVPVTGLMVGNSVTATLISSSNPVRISNITVNAGSFDITFTADPGASAIIMYQAFTTHP